MTTYVLAVDPGKKTGFATWTPEWERPFIDQEDFGPFLARADQLMALHGPELLVVCEAYIVSMETVKKGRQGDKGDPYRQFSLEVIGALRYLALKHGSTFGPLQTASEAKTIVTDARLRKLGWYERGKEHGRDAARHLALWMLKTKILSPDAIV